MTQPATNLTWIKAMRPEQKRDHTESLRDAAEALLIEGAWEQCTVAEIAHRAGVSVSAFGARFRDKDDLLNSLHERFTAEAGATCDAILALERWEGSSIPEIIRETVSFTVSTYRERESLIRAFIGRSATDEAFRQRSLDLSLRIAELLRKLVLARRKELLHPAPAIAAEVSARLIHGLLTSRVLLRENGEGSGIRLNDEQIGTELMHAVLAYLGVFTTDAWDS